MERARLDEEISMKKLCTRVFALGMLLAVAAPAAFADGGMKTYPAANCVSNDPDYWTTSYAYGRNNGTGAATLYCPIVREESSLLTQAGTVWVTDRHYSENVCCSSRSKNPGGNALRFTADQCSSGVDGGVALAFSGPVMAGSWEHRFFQCTLPGTYEGNASEVLTYRSQEL
jgi:hypothetical protein